MNICPTRFGPYFWTVIHMACLSAGKDVSEERASALSDFVSSLPGVLPCRQCGKHLKENLETLPFDREDPFRWSVDLHNLVNAQLNKPEIEYDKAFQYWSRRCSSTGPSKQNWLIIFLIVVIVFLVLFTGRIRG